MSLLTVTLIRLALLVLLWLFVLAGYGVIRRDLFGAKVAPRTTARPRVPQPKPAKPTRRKHAPSRLVVTDGALAGTTLQLGDRPITMGRASDSTLVIDDDYASTRHAQLVPYDGEWMLEDMGSTNGTFLGRGKVGRPTPVPVGEPIRIGKTVLELRR
ncbi:MAG: FHA domain-containing protein [Streptosporangiales bacterium]|nr:FHA domain-containing protein [Streptosporangiales bacterium]